MTHGDEPEAVGLQALLGDGLADAMAAADAMMGDVQRALRQTLGGLSAAQAAGAAVTSVPPVVTVSATAPLETAGMPPRSAPEPSPSQLDRVGAPSAGETAAPMAPAAPAPAFPGTTRPAEASAGIVKRVHAAPVPLVNFAPVTPGISASSNTDEADAAKPMHPMPRAERSYSTVRAHTSISASQGGAGEEPDDAVQPTRAMAPAAQPAGSTGPTGGDVFLDGTRMGTWIADHLAREAGRPQLGGTGFDPRLTPAWPGTMQGG